MLLRSAWSHARIAVIDDLRRLKRREHLIQEITVEYGIPL
jgi:hypothetical protein